MALSIDDDKGQMTSDECATVATRTGEDRWEVTGRAGTFTRDQAITAMTVAEVRAMDLPPDHGLWLFVLDWEAELAENAQEVPDADA